MAELEYDIILAKAGYNEKYNRTVTWDELRKSFLLYKRIPMIVAGGSHSGPIDPNEAVGIVDARLDDENETVRGRAVFFKEKFKDVPAEIQQRLMYKRHVPASLGYEQFNNLRKLDHLAIGVESPVFKDIGFNAEDTFRYEDTEGLNREAQETPATTKPPDTAQKKDTEIQSLRAEIGELRSLIKGLAEQTQKKVTSQTSKSVEVTEEEQPTVTETENTPPPEEEQKEPTDLPVPERPRVEPSRPLPKSTGTQTSDGWLLDADGRRYLSIHVAGTTNKTDNKTTTTIE